jgi:hypothetical protein
MERHAAPPACEPDLDRRFSQVVCRSIAIRQGASMRSLVGLAVLLGALSPVRLSGQAPSPGAPAERPAGLTEWQPSQQMPGVFYMPLLGEATKPGAYVYRVRAPHGLRIPPHWHTKTMHLTVLTGTLMIAMGEPSDSSRARPCGPGSFLALPAGMRHREWFEGETIVHVETEGPFETVFVDPGDEPRPARNP